MIYVVLGMHKSGTTLVASLLHHAGIPMVEHEPQGDYEQDGFYEREATFLLNLDMMDTHADDVLFYTLPQNLTLSEAQRRRVREICEAQHHTDWGFKDPRTCLTYTLWAEELPPHRLVIVFRPVEDMWHRFQYDGWRFWKNFSRGMALVARWCEHNQRILSAVGQTSCAFIVLSYRHLMADEDELQRLAAFVERPLQDTRRRARAVESIRTPLIIRLAIGLVRVRMNYRYNDILRQLDELRYQTQ